MTEPLNATSPEPHGWYGPPNSRRYHYFGTDGRSLCGKWFVLAWTADLIDTATGYTADGDCAACKRKLETSQYVTADVAEVIEALGAPDAPGGPS